jgi:hypothetical protein
MTARARNRRSSKPIYRVNSASWISRFSTTGLGSILKQDAGLPCPSPMSFRYGRGMSLVVSAAGRVGNPGALVSAPQPHAGRIVRLRAQNPATNSMARPFGRQRSRAVTPRK